MRSRRLRCFSNDPQDDYPAIIAVAAKKLSEDVAAGKDSRAIVAGASDKAKPS
jgi:hypothetical protein